LLLSDESDGADKSEFGINFAKEQNFGKV